jgi:hypothetical protein
MKNLKNLLQTFLITSFIFIISCQKTDTTPAVDNTDYLAMMVGNWTFAESCSGFGTGSNKVSITKSATVTNGIIIDGLAGFNDYKINATQSGAGFTISSQKFNNGGLTISGNGALDGTNLKITYTNVNNGVTVNSCTSTGKKN